ncbi:MAG: DNA polymerase IV [Planctomycetes bacterium]|jgi:DNA polymerase-4|nr:DNA polymerase IV [Planctomycetota bacterium]
MEPGILHVDMDAFYASVEVLDRPELRGQPVIVGGRPDARGVVSAASYEARAFGVHSAMPLRHAGRLCPGGVFLPVRMDRYAEISAHVFAIFRDYTPLVEGLSLDEAFLDVRGSERLFGPGPAIGRDIQRRIAGEIGIGCSVGAAPVKFVAKIASDLRKPNGFVVVREGEVEAFLAPLAVERLWGVGEVTAAQLRHLGLTTIGDLARVGQAYLAERFGEHGRQLHELASGRDARAVSPGAERKQVGHETTFDADIGDRDRLLAALLRISEEVAHRAREAGSKGRTVTVKLRYAPFETHTVRRTLASATDCTAEIFSAAKELFLAAARVPPRLVRLLGVTLGALEDLRGRQLGLFDNDRRRARCVDETMDRIAERHGRDAILRAGGLGARSRRKSERSDEDGEVSP